jgi:hypothetical protein
LHVPGRAPNQNTDHSKLLKSCAPTEQTGAHNQTFEKVSDQKEPFVLAEMGSFGLEILVNHQGDAARMQSNVLENLLGLLETKCIDRYALPHSFEATDTAQDSRKRKLSSCVEGESDSECKHKSKRVRFAVNSKFRLVTEHSNSNDYRMSQDNFLIEDTESSLAADLPPNENDGLDAFSFPAGEDQGSDEDQDESDDDSLDEFAGFAESESESEASEAGAQSTPAMRRDVVDDARSNSSECEQDLVPSSYGTDEAELSFEDAEVRTKEEDGPSIATTVAQVRAHTPNHCDSRTDSRTAHQNLMGQVHSNTLCSRVQDP